MRISKTKLSQADRYWRSFVFDGPFWRIFLFASVLVCLGSAITDTAGHPLHLIWLFPLFLGSIVLFVSSTYFFSTVSDFAHRRIADGILMSVLSAAFLCF